MAAPNDLPREMLASAANERALHALLGALRDDRPLLLVGEDIAADAGYPTRRSFLTTMEAHARALRPKSAAEIDDIAASEDLAWRAEEMRRLLGERDFKALLRTEYGPRPTTHTDTESALLKLPWAHVLTLNFDSSLEHAHTAALGSIAETLLWNDSASVEELLSRSADPTYRRRYMYLHGRYDREGVLLTESDRAARYDADRDRSEHLFSLFDRHPVVLVGVALADLDLMPYLRRQSALRDGEPRHFALLPRPARGEDVERRRLRTRYGVDPVFVAGTLAPVLAWLHARVHEQPAPSAAPQRAPSVHLTHLSIAGLAFADGTTFQFGARLNLVTGANSAGKTVALDALWWALTDTWATLPLLPERGDAAAAALSVTWSDHREQTARYVQSSQTWQQEPGWGRTASLALYVQADGSVAVYDPLQAQALRFAPASQLFDGLRASDGTQRCNGIIDDLVRWRTGAPALFDAMQRVLARMSPPDLPMGLGVPRRVFLADAREFPTVTLPYGEVPVVHASAAVRRILAFAYTILWAWNEHRARAALAGLDPSRHLVVLVDEVEAHLHPLWQRAVLPALFEAVAEVSRDLTVQVFATTHAPLVTASVEPLFDAARDRLFHLALRDGAVHVDVLPFARQGDVSAWLLSDTFGMRHARSLEAERALEAAKAILRGETPAAPLDTPERVHAELKRVLAGQDDFWPRWIATTGLSS